MASALGAGLALPLGGIGAPAPMQPPDNIGKIPPRYPSPMLIMYARALGKYRK